MRTHYTTQVRVLLCPHCGGPLTSAVTGGSVRCTYCGATNMLDPRDPRVAIIETG